MCVLASQPVSPSVLSLPGPPPRATSVKKTKRERAERDGGEEGGKKETFHRFQKESIGEEHQPPPHPNHITQENFYLWLMEFA